MSLAVIHSCVRCAGHGHGCISSDLEVAVNKAYLVVALYFAAGRSDGVMSNILAFCAAQIVHNGISVQIARYRCLQLGVSVAVDLRVVNGGNSNCLRLDLVGYRCLAAVVAFTSYGYGYSTNIGSVLAVAQGVIGAFYQNLVAVRDNRLLLLRLAVVGYIIGSLYSKPGDIRLLQLVLNIVLILAIGRNCGRERCRIRASRIRVPGVSVQNIGFAVIHLGARICILRQSRCVELIVYSKVVSIGLLRLSIRHYHPEFRRNDLLALDFDRAVQMLVRGGAIVFGNFVRNKVNILNIICCDRESISRALVSIFGIVKLIFNLLFICIENFIPNRSSLGDTASLHAIYCNHFSIRIAANILARGEDIFAVITWSTRNIHFGGAVRSFAPFAGFIGIWIRCRKLQIVNYGRFSFFHLNREGFSSVPPCVRNCCSTRFHTGHGYLVAIIIH